MILPPYAYGGEAGDPRRGLLSHPLAEPSGHQTLPPDDDGDFERYHYEANLYEGHHYQSFRPRCGLARPPKGVPYASTIRSVCWWPRKYTVSPSTRNRALLTPYCRKQVT